MNPLDRPPLGILLSPPELSGGAAPQKQRPSGPQKLKTSNLLSAEELARALGGKRAGSGWIAHCPAHDDRIPSLSLSDGETGLLWFCHAGCSQEAVASALREKGLFPPVAAGTPSSRSGFRTPGELASWLARKTGATVSRVDLYSPIFAEIRLDTSNNKTYRPIHRIPPGGWKTGDPPGKLPIYKADQLPFDPKTPVLVVEGPKCADAARILGLSATTSPHGANSAWKADWTPLRDRREVVIWPDNDDPGKKYASDVRAILISLGIPQNGIRILDPERFGLGAGEDIVDWIARHPGETPDLSGIPDRDDEPEQSNPDWISLLDRTPTGRLTPNARSLGLILRNDPSCQALRYNEFSKLIFVGDRALEDSDLFVLAEKIETSYGRGSTVPIARLREAVEAVSAERPYHPIREWLASLVWDGIPRLDDLMSRYFGVEDTPYGRAVGKNSLIAAVARIRNPGSKVDTMPVLEGEQGTRKSSGIAVLFGEEWTAISTAPVGTKDFVAGLQGKWVLEIAEMDSFSRAEVSRIKANLSATSDWVRLSYRPDNQDLPRQCVFWGTTNDSQYLEDATGARRFWPVACGKIDLEALRNDRDQLWAEAVKRYQDGETWWEVPDQAREEQSARFRDDSWDEIITPWLAGRPEITTTEILRDCLEMDPRDHSHAAQVRVGNILKRRKWKRVRIRRGSCLAWVYRPPESVPNPELGTDGNKLGTSSTDAIVPNVPVENEVPTPIRSPLLSPKNSIEINRNIGTIRNKPIPEPCSRPVPNSGFFGELGTNDTDMWEVD